MPEMVVLPHDKGGLLGKIVGTAAAAAAGTASTSSGMSTETGDGADEPGDDVGAGLLDSPPETEVNPASAAVSAAGLLTPDLRAALRLLAPFLMTGTGVG